MKHHPGIIPVSAAKALERLGFYGLRSILLLYMVNGSLQMTHSQASKIYGIFITALGFMPLLGGLLSDFVMGSRLTAIIGCFIQAFGCLLFLVPNTYFLYAALSLLALGQGLSTPAMMSQVSLLYKDRPKYIDAGMNIFYVTINLGALLSPIIIGYMGETFGYHYGFICAALCATAAAGILLASGQMLRDLPFRPNFSLPATKSGSLHHPAIIIGFILLFIAQPVYWYFFSNVSFSQTMLLENHTFSNGTMPRMSWYYNAESIVIMGLGIFMALVWTFINISSLLKLMIGFLIYALGCSVLVMANDNMSDFSILTTVIGFIFIQALSEIFIAPIAMAFIARHAPARFNGLILSSFLVSTYLVNAVIAWFIPGTYDTTHSYHFLVFGLVLAFFAFIFLVLFLVNRNNDTTQPDNINTPKSAA
ncbi:MAG: MFS transporter [Bacteroidetes bacterium]|nr:MFS transporter [Bacteroidota bacterium]